MVIVPGNVVLAVVTESHCPPEVVVAEVVNGTSAVVLARDTFCCTAAVPVPAVNVTDAGVGVTVIEEVAFNVTWIVVGRPPVNGEKVTVPVYVPGVVIDAMFTPTDTVAGVALVPEETKRKLFVEVAVAWKNCWVPSALPTVTFCAGTVVVAPTMPLNVNVDGLTMNEPTVPPPALICTGMAVIPKPLPAVGVSVNVPEVPAGTACGNTIETVS
jgi:hypothetical protein